MSEQWPNASRPSLSAQQTDQSIDAAADRFRERFGCAARVVIRAPGRVNLIGEHTDYNGLPVLPFAIAQSHCLAAADCGQPVIEIANADPQYGPKAIALDDLSAFSTAGQWDNYLRAALMGLLDTGLIEREHLSGGLRVAVSSDLPARVGLSSSSALVVGFALAALHAHRVQFERLRLAEALAEAEHYVGTRGGGMDQAVCLLGQKDHAARIDFFPLQVEPVSFGEGVEVFLADSGVRVEKSSAGRALFNRRPIECRLALALFKKWAASHDRDAPWGKWIGQGHERVRYWGDLVKPPLKLPHESLLPAIREALVQPRYTTADLIKHLGLGEIELRETYLKMGADEYMPEPSDGFRLRQRAEHVVAEALRVEQAVAALRERNWGRLGNLISASHESCRDLYEISCPEIERLVTAAAETGALASRLTGAGFGGCTLHLVGQDSGERFIGEMRRHLGTTLRLWKVVPSPGAEVEI
ncbi:galactokinase [Candidatus Sumerlaeota bacterium]|nr:galactokinase [Candidatus Sumerlaeota bacterium]